MTQGEDKKPCETHAPVAGVEEQACHDCNAGDGASGALDPRAGCVVIRPCLGEGDLSDRNVVGDGSPAPDLVRVLQPRPGIGDSSTG